MGRLLVLAVAAFAFACAGTHDHVMLAFNETGEVTITTASPFKDNWVHRFDHIAPEREKITYVRERGEVTEVEHSATVAADDLQKFFFDVDMTIKLTHGDGYDELAMYPATSSRAKREERDEFSRRVHVAAAALVNYFAATRRLYGYLDANPQRAESAFRNMFADKDNDVYAISPEEKELIVDVRHAMEAASKTAPEKGAQDRFFDLADRVNDPFPGIITVSLPVAYTSMEGFQRVDATTLRAEVTSPADALLALEGRWLSPDPLALALRGATLDPPELAHQRRRVSLSVTADDVAEAFIAQIKPKSIYRVRWVVTASSS